MFLDLARTALEADELVVLVLVCSRVSNWKHLSSMCPAISPMVAIVRIAPITVTILSIQSRYEVVRGLQGTTT